MPFANLNPIVAAGSGWASPANAVPPSDSAFASWPVGSVTPENLRVYNVNTAAIDPDSEVLGIVIHVDADALDVRPGGGVYGLVKRAVGVTIETVDGQSVEVIDSNNSTYYGDVSAVPGVFAPITVIHDLGSALSPASFRFVISSEGDGFYIDLYDSSDGVSWSLISSPPTVYLAGDDQFISRTITGRTARYWRAEITPAGFSPGPTRLRVQEAKLYTGASVVMTSHPNTGGQYERIDVALSKDSISPATAWETLEIPLGGGICVAGGVYDLWGESWTMSDFGPTFGVLVRRHTGPGEILGSARLVDSVYGFLYYDPAGGSFEPMPNRNASTQFCLIGPETTPGTGVNPTHRLRATKVELMPANEEMAIEYAGETLDGDTHPVSFACEGDVSGVPTYDELGFILASVCGKPQTSVVTAGVYRHEFRLVGRGISDPRSYTHENGDVNFAERVANVLFGDFSIESTRKSTSLKGKAFGRKMVKQSGITPGVNEVQSISITGTPTGGNYRLRFNGQETANLAYNADAAAIQTALRALTTIGAAECTVTGTGPFTVTFTGAMAGKDQPVIELSLNSLTGGASPTVTITTTTQGGYIELPSTPILPGDTSVYYATTFDGLAAGKMTNLHGGEFAVSGRRSPFYVMDDTNDSFYSAAEPKGSASMKLTVQDDAFSAALMVDHAGSAGRFIRWASTSKYEIIPTYKYSMTIDASVKVGSVEGHSVDQEIYARTFNLKTVYDPGLGYHARIVLVNGVPSY